MRNTFLRRKKLKDITDKFETLREAVASARLILPEEGRSLIEGKRVAKGDPFEVARISAIGACKRTWEIIPFCHPIPITFCGIEFEWEGNDLIIRARVRAIASTGVEMEALTAVSVAVLTVYDMLKPHLDSMEIGGIKLLEKRGGKSDWQEELDPPVKTAILVVSDSVSQGKKEDRAGKAVRDFLKGERGVEIVAEEVVGDERDEIQRRLKEYIGKGVELIFTIGGTGLSPRDVTVEAVRSILDREISGIPEAIRAYGQRRTPYSMLSRGIAGLKGGTLIVTLPGSSRGARESIQALFPGLLHIFRVLRRFPHRWGYEEG